MPSLNALASELATTNANLLALAQLVAANTAADAALAAAVKALATQQGVDETTLAGLVAAMPPPVVVPPTVTDPQVQWRASMETGDLNAWSEQVNSGVASSSAVQIALDGITPRLSRLFNLPSLWAMKQSVSGTGGTRMHRYPEVDALSRAGKTFYWSWWDYYPAKITFAPSDMFMLWQMASADAAGVGQPLWGLYLNGTDGTLVLGWNPTGAAPAEGPHAGESGKRAYTSVVPLPIAQWVFFEVMIKPAGDFTGAIKLWMNGQVIFDQSLVKTQFPYVGLSGFMYCTQNAYGSGLTPVPAVHYVDDVTISLGRMP